MNNIKLVRGRYSLARGANQEILRSSSDNLLIYDNKSQSLFELPPLPEIISFFNLSLEESEMSEDQENTSLEDETPMQENECFVQNPKRARLDKTQQSTRKMRNVCDEIDLNSDNNSNAGSVKLNTAVWDDKAVKLLFAVYKDHEDDFKNTAIKNDVVWEKIKTQLTIDGYNFTRTQIKDKWMNMRRNYMKVKDHNKQTGAKLKTYRYYEEMDNIYGDKPNVNPVSLASNMGNNNEISCSEDSAVEDDQVKRKSKIERQLSGWTEKFIEYSKEQENRREERQTKKIAAMENATKIFKDMMEKLIEKL